MTGETAGLAAGGRPTIGDMVGRVALGLVAFHRAMLGHGSVPLDVLGLAVRGELGLSEVEQGGARR